MYGVAAHGGVARQSPARASQPGAELDERRARGRRPGAATRPRMAGRQPRVQFPGERGQPRLDVVERRRCASLRERLPRVVQVGACVLAACAARAQAARRGSARAAGQRRRRQQQVEHRAERLLDVELRDRGARPAATSSSQLHARDGRADEAVVHLPRHGPGRRVDGPLAALEARRGRRGGRRPPPATSRAASRPAVRCGGCRRRSTAGGPRAMPRSRGRGRRADRPPRSAGTTRPASRRQQQECAWPELAPGGHRRDESSR